MRPGSRSRGAAKEAEAVKGLQKPPISAWTVNQLFWKHRPAFDKLLDAGQQFRTAQAAQLSGRSTDIRGPLESRREALADLSRLSAQVLRDAGHSPSPDVMRRVTTTLEALATYGGLPDTPRPGRLSDDVDPPGFETLAALVPRVGDGGTTGPSRVCRSSRRRRRRRRHAAQRRTQGKEREREAERKAQLAAAKAAVQQGEQALRGARKQAEQAESQLKKAAARAKESERDLREIEKEKAAIDKRYEKAAADAESARQEARAVAERAEAAAESVEDAERELEKARRELTTLA